jgi:hypothetical protein
MYATKADYWHCDNWSEEHSQPRLTRWIKKREVASAWKFKDRSVSAVSSKLTQAIEAAAERLRALEEDWDDQGAQPIREETIQRAARFLHLAAAQLAARGTELPIPRISPCADGSVDLFWKDGEFRLLMNVQPGETVSDFYGEGPEGVQVKGPFQPESHDISNYFRWLRP